MKQLFITGFLLLAGSFAAEAQFTNNGSMRLFSGATVSFFGNVKNNGTLIDSGTVVTMAGTSAQTIDGTSVISWRNLTLNNASATGVTLGQAMDVRGTLTFTDGYLVTTATNILTLTSGAAVSGASNNSFVSGPVHKLGNQSFVFPVGKNVVYAPIAMSAPAVATDKFTAEYFQVSPNALYNVNSKEATINHVSQCEYWMLNRTTGTSNVTVNLSWDTRSCGVTFLPDLRVARWDGSQWTDKGNGGTTGTTTAGTVVSAAAVTGFGPFTLASVSSNNPLPVELVGFSAACEDNSAVLRWNTASELNNDYFTIESSADAMDWKTVATVDGAGNSTELLSYAYTDVSAPGKDLYYRLKQTDVDGHTVAHEILYLESCTVKPGENAVSVYPNPAKDIVTIATQETVSAISVFQADGKALEGIAIDLEGRRVDFSAVPAGMYFIVIAMPDKIVNERIIISGR